MPLDPMASSLVLSDDLAPRQVSDRIHFIRGQHVILDSDLAWMYGVETKALNKAVSRNANRFPEHFRFQLLPNEWSNLRFQSGTSSATHGGRRFLPFAFTEQGVAMLSAVLSSDRAVQVSIRIMDSFVEMRRFFLQNATLFEKVDQLELRQLAHIAESDEKFNKLFNALEKSTTSDIASQGIFFEGQIFDAYAFVSALIRKAKKTINLIDNYIDESVLLLLGKRKSGVSAIIHTGRPTKQLQLDLCKNNEQYPPIHLAVSPGWHDRFLIIDNHAVYHIGASLKDLGKKCFAFSRMDQMALQILNKLADHQPPTP